MHSWYMHMTSAPLLVHGFPDHQALNLRVTSLVEPLWATGAWLAMAHHGS
jgi:hypothetical protein